VTPNVTNRCDTNSPADLQDDVVPIHTHAMEMTQNTTTLMTNVDNNVQKDDKVVMNIPHVIIYDDNTKSPPLPNTKTNYENDATNLIHYSTNSDINYTIPADSDDDDITVVTSNAASPYTSSARIQTNKMVDNNAQCQTDMSHVDIEHLLLKRNSLQYNLSVATSTNKSNSCIISDMNIEISNI